MGISITMAENDGNGMWDIGSGIQDTFSMIENETKESETEWEFP